MSDLGRLDWEDLRIFLAVARAGTLTAAASALRISQPTAGRRLRALEETCGFSLFQRGPAGLLATEEGRLVRLHAERMEEEALALARRFRGTGPGLTGKLRLSASEWFSRLVLTPAIAGFCRRHPDVTVELVIDSRVVDLDRQEADLVFRFPQFDTPAIVQKRFVEIRYGLYAARDYLDRMADVPPDSAAHRLIGMDSQLTGLPDVAWLRTRYPNAGYAFCSNARDLQARACADGVGLAVLPSILGDSTGLVAISGQDAPPSRIIRLGYHTDLRRLRRLRALLDHLAETVPATV